jgi:hypothetical protein
LRVRTLFLCIGPVMPIDTIYYTIGGPKPTRFGAVWSFHRRQTFRSQQEPIVYLFGQRKIRALTECIGPSRSDILPYVDKTAH